MGRNRLLARLRDAEAEAQQDRTRILEQKVAIAALRAMGVNASEAEQTLLIFERAQDAHLSEIERIKDALNSGIFTDEVIRSLIELVVYQTAVRSLGISMNTTAAPIHKVAVAAKVLAKMPCAA